MSTFRQVYQRVLGMDGMFRAIVPYAFTVYCSIPISFTCLAGTLTSVIVHDECEYAETTLFIISPSCSGVHFFLCESGTHIFAVSSIVSLTSWSFQNFIGCIAFVPVISSSVCCTLLKSGTSMSGLSIF